MDDTDLRILRLSQEGIPLVDEPFAEMAGKLGIGEPELLERLRNMMDNGIIRRFGASIGHRAIGIRANAMCTWNVPDERVEEVGKLMAGFPEVTHCYQRPRKPGWKYNLYTMVHAYTKKECRAAAKRISHATGIRDYDILFSEREFKKTGVRI